MAFHGARRARRDTQTRQPARDEAVRHAVTLATGLLVFGLLQGLQGLAAGQQQQQQQAPQTNAASASNGANARSYQNYAVLRVVPATEDQVSALRRFDDQDGVDWWTPPRVGADADIMVSPRVRGYVQQTFAALGLPYEVLHENLQEHVSGVDKELAAAQLAARFVSDVYVDNKRYLLYDEIEYYIKRLGDNHPNKVRVIDIGPTFEQRRMYVVHLSNCFACNHTAIWIDAGIHAREWIAPATALYALSQLAENETAHQDMRSNLDWFILAVANPDGYQFTHTTDRMWRKTRSSTSMAGCYGADPNRNFEFHWNEVGASKYPCSETYAGRKAFSEVEAVNMRNFLWKNRMKIKLYISYHSYGNYLLYPWGFTAENPNDWRTLKSVATKVNDALVRAGSKPYTIGSSTQTLYAAAGGSDDWAKGIAGIPLSYTIELPGYRYGFQLPPKYIDQVARQSFEGLRVFAREVKNLYVKGAAGDGGDGGDADGADTAGNAGNPDESLSFAVPDIKPQRVGQRPPVTSRAFG